MNHYNHIIIIPTHYPRFYTYLYMNLLSSISKIIYGLYSNYEATLSDCLLLFSFSYSYYF